MYEKPVLQRFGTFRELTRIGPDTGADLGSVFGISGCNGLDTPGSDFGCQATRGSR